MPAMPRRQSPFLSIMLASVSDLTLVDSLRQAAPDATREFERRFRRTLEVFARRVRIPHEDAEAVITDVLSDEAIRLADRAVTPPANIAAYLIRSLRNRYLNDRRAAERRVQRHAAAADEQLGEWVVTSLCSEDALRSSAGPLDGVPPTRAVLERLAVDLRAEITDEEHSILMWISQGASHSEIAAWLGASYEASTKRIWRLCRRLRTKACDRAATYSQDDQSEFERFLRRVDQPSGSTKRRASA